ncbi:hypothetical protein LOTGIDRAFT_213963 [Lottia gigantea]|uniref:3-dehydrosphinganine reductase n=1 Tax=Lottia gigantea TaxID=225164 RepID=V4AMH6_LOTGI|nr:hypothetical protein LOTGIDRAFT_213963 [Lottia gigantea]ESO98337.1 hypothetical protein LOTGIDRAFT_213963 [Lottia gigantea]
MILIIILYFVSPLITPKPLNLTGAHVLVTGGSSGIGKALAINVAKQGANVTLLARNKNKLQEAKVEVEKHFINKDTQSIICISVDISKEYEPVEKAVKQAEEKFGAVRLLINCAGTSIAGVFEELPVTEFKRMLDINYLGSVYVTRAVIPTMKKEHKGRIVFVSSQAGQLGLFGYTAYSASKFALRGLSEALQMELKPYDIRVTMAFPPDTDTPGYAEEQKTKPRETHLISEVAGLFSPHEVAKTIVEDSIKGKFFSYMGLDGYMLSSLTCGMSPVISMMDAAQQVVTSGIFRVISLFYLDYFDRIVKKCKNDKQTEDKKSS